MEIHSPRDFDDAVRAECLVVITDDGYKNKVHRLDCEYVTAKSFTDKVMNGHGKNGRYYVVGSVERAQGLHSAVPCGACKPG